MRKLMGLLAVGAVGLAAVGVAGGGPPAPRTFVAPMDPFQEVPRCLAAGNSARGLAIFHVTDRATGTVRYKLVANNIPGTTFAAHIHVAPRGAAGPIVQPLPITPGAENGVIGQGTFTNAALVAAMQASPQLYYVNVHSTACPPGAVRGQLGERGPPGLGQ